MIIRGKWKNSASSNTCEAPAISSFPLKPGEQLKLKVTMESLGGGLWFPNYHIFWVNNKKLIIVLAILTGFNKIGSLERSRLRARLFCFCRGIFVWVCVCVPVKGHAWMCVSDQNFFSSIFALCCMHAHYTLGVGHVWAVSLTKKTPNRLKS